MHHKLAFKELVVRYHVVLKFWWDRRELIKIPELKNHEAEFMPAALSIQTAPVSPAGRWIARILLGIILISLIWSVFGKVDIIVNGQGKIIPGGYTKTIASVEVAKVVALHVEEGQAVKRGDLLIELDSRGFVSEKDKAESDRQLSLLQMERSKAFLLALENDNPPQLSPIDGVDSIYFGNEKIHLADQWRDYQVKRIHLATQIKRFSAELALAALRAKDYEQLAKDHDVSTHAYLEKKQASIDLEGQLNDQQTQMTVLTAETRKTTQDDLYQATRTWSGAIQDIKKASAHSEQLNIVSPVDGVVQQLTVHTVGGVVPVAQALMLIVPDQHTVELEAYVENKDIGFLHEGQAAQVKIDAYEYTKYGTVPAIIGHLSRDAVDSSGSGVGPTANKSIEGKKEAGNGLFYTIKVFLQTSTIIVDGRRMALSPGMAGSVEIKTGERRIIEYVLSPLLTHARESLHER